MDTIILGGKKYDNWKEYLFDKFGESNQFRIERLAKDDVVIEHYRVTSTIEDCKTEVIFQIYKDEGYQELFDVHFNHPKSPKLTENNKSNTRGLDGLGTTFNENNLNDTDDWLKIPTIYGWVEKTTYFENKELKTECVWIQDGKRTEIPMKLNYLDNYGCLLLPVVPIKSMITNWKIKKNRDKVRIEEQVIDPMVKMK